MSNVASKANVHHQPALPGVRPRTGGPQAPNAASPFAMLLDTGDAAPAPKPQRSDRAQPSANARASAAGDSKREQPTAATQEAAETEQQVQAPETEQQAPATEPTAAVDETKPANAKTALDPSAIAVLAEGGVKAEENAAVDLSLLTPAPTDPATTVPKEPLGLAVALAATAEIETTPGANAAAVQLAVTGGVAKPVAPGAQASDAALKGQAGGATAPNETDQDAAKTANPAPILAQSEAKTEGTTEAKPAAKTEASTTAGVKAEAAQGPKESNAAAQAESKHDNPAGRPQDAAQKPAEPSPARFDPHARDTADLAKPGPDGAQLSAMHITTERFGNLAAQATQPVGATAASLTTAAVPIAGLAVEIAARAQAGGNRFEIRLDPPELGRIDVRLDVDRSGQVTSRLVVEKAETLDLLRRDAAELERALQQAGLKTAENGMQFSLRDQSFAGRDGGPAAGSATVIVPDSELGPAEILAASYGRVLRPGGGIDIRV